MDEQDPVSLQAELVETVAAAAKEAESYGTLEHGPRASAATRT